MTETRLREKASKYEGMLSEALESIEPGAGFDNDKAVEFREMAESYLEDGRHFRGEGDEVNALAAFSYGHAWLDAGMRMGFYDTDRYDLFTVDPDET